MTISSPHSLYETGDIDVPQQILDRNGEVALACCRRCGGVEGALPTDCPGVRMTLQQADDVYSGRDDYRDGQWVWA